VTPDEKRRVARQLLRYADGLIAEAEAEPAKPPVAPRGPGRPKIEPTAEQVISIAQLSIRKLGLRAIGERVGLSWEVVQRVRRQLDANY
jgi:hypothetical protein